MIKLFRTICAMATISLLLLACGNEKDPAHKRPNWQALTSLTQDKSDFALTVKMNKAYQLGEPIQLSVSSGKDGKLWIIYVDPDDNVSLLFPNSFAADNRISAAKPLLVPADQQWTMRAIEPAGKSLLGFIVTAGQEQPAQSFAGKDFKSIEQVLQKLNPTSARAVSVHLIEISKPGSRTDGHVTSV